MDFWAVKIEFSWFRSMALPWIRFGEGNRSFLRPQVYLTLHFFSRTPTEKLIQTLSPCQNEKLNI